jgi:hypothetical protein
LRRSLTASRSLGLLGRSRLLTMRGGGSFGSLAFCASNSSCHALEAAHARSRLTGFARDIMLAAILGAGPVADAFFVAFRLPNHFRAIFAEGAFNAAFVPAYAHVHGEKG